MEKYNHFEAKYAPEYISTETPGNEWLKENPNDYYEALYLMYEILEEEK